MHETPRSDAAALKGGHESSIRQDETALDTVSIACLAAEEEGRCVVVLHDEQPVITSETEMWRREPLDPAANVARHEGLVVLDAEQAGFPMRRQRNAAKSTSEVWDQRTVASA